MTRAKRIALLGLMAGTAVTLAAGIGTAQGRMGGMGPMGGGMGSMGNGIGGPGGPFVASSFADLDSDGSGQITEEDFAQLRASRFAEVDTDGDGKVTADELAAHMKAQMEARMAQAPGLGQRRGDPDTMAKTMAERMIAARDTDEDGSLTAEEMAPKVDYGRLIDRFDTTDDNAISEDEYNAARAEMQNRGGRMAGAAGGFNGPRGNSRGGMMQRDCYPQAMQGMRGGMGPQGMQQGWGQQGWGQQGPQRGWGYAPQQVPQGNGYGYGPQGMQPGRSFGPQGMQPGYGYGPQGMQPGYGYGPQGMQPGYGYGMGPQQGFGPQGMAPGTGWGAQGMQPGTAPQQGMAPTAGDGAVAPDDGGAQ